MKPGLVIALLAAGAAAASAQPAAPSNTAAFDTVEVAIWPEYDRPEVLVMYRARLDPSTALPARVVFPVPAAVGKPHAVAKRGQDGALYQADHTYSVDGDWAAVELISDSLHVQLEYYAPLEIEDAARRFELSWPGGTTVDELRYEIQQPIGATAVSIVPEPAQSQPRGDGLTYHSGAIEDRGADGAASVVLRYEKRDGRLTAQAVQPQGNPPPAPTSGDLLDSVRSTPPPAPQPSVASAPAGDRGPHWALVALLIVAALAIGIVVGRVTAHSSDSESS